MTNPPSGGQWPSLQLPILPGVQEPDASPDSCPTARVRLKATRAQESRRRGLLIVTTGAEAGRVFPVPMLGQMTIGRSQSCTVCVRESSVSRIHAEVANVDGEFLLKDAASTNGTFVNEVPVDSQVRLRTGDRIRLGASTVVWFTRAHEGEVDALTSAYNGALRDGLTGLYNRRYLDMVLDAEVQLSIRKRLELSVVLLDVDHFKRVNDALGHLAGDAALRKVGAVVSRQVRAGDVAVRYGGEEFVVVARGTAIEEARLLADRLRKAIPREPLWWNGQVVPLTVSLGVASLACCGSSPGRDQLLSLADQRMYVAKETRNCVVGL